MENGKVCEYIQTIGLNGEEFVSDLCVKEGYGQSCGGYLSLHKKDLKIEGLTQKDHFLDYYNKENKKDKNPSYGYLRCPQLLLFIAEVAGVQRERVDSAYEILKNYEDENNLRFKEKNGNYIWGKQIFREFKEKLCINMVVKIIIDSESWDEVKENTKNL